MTGLTEAALLTRLQFLRAERTQALAQLGPREVGDAADQAVSVDAEVLLADLDERIAAVEAELVESRRSGVQKQPGIVTVGDVLTLDFGEGPERCLFASISHNDGELPVVTPDSPLGRALPGAAAGDRVSYAASDGQVRQVHVIRAD